VGSPRLLVPSTTALTVTAGLTAIPATAALLTLSAALQAGAPFLIYRARGDLALTSSLEASSSLHYRSTAPLGIGADLVSSAPSL